MRAAPAYGARVTYRIGPAWMVSAEASRGATRYHHLTEATAGMNFQLLEPIAGVNLSRTERWGEGSITSVLMSTGRTRALYSTGRTDTSPFFVDFRPEFDQYEADRSHLVGVFLLTLGVGLGL